MDKDKILERSREENWPNDEMQKQLRYKRINFGAYGVFICIIIVAICRVYKHQQIWDLLAMSNTFIFSVIVFDVIKQKGIANKILCVAGALVMLCFVAYYFQKFWTGAM